MNKQNVFGRSRLRLMLRYALVMGGLVIVLLFAMHKTMEWAITSEQARELLDTADSVAEAQAYAVLHAGMDTDEAQLYRSTNDRLFYYVFDGEGRLVSFSRASFRIESFVLDILTTWDAPEREVRVFTKTNERGTSTKVMMTAQTVFSPPLPVQTVYVGKDVTAMYNGMEKATWALAILGGLALVFAAAIGYVLSGGAMKPVREAYEKQRQFAADASHELRTPLASVQGYAQLARRDIGEASRTQALERISSEGARMASLVEEMLTLARLDGNRALKRDTIDVIPLILDALSDAHVVAPDHAWELDEASDIQVLGDEAALRQILTNLLANARVHTPAGTRVTVSLSRVPDGGGAGTDAPASSMVRIRVADDGPGIPAEIRDRVFDRFVRGDSSRTRDGRGSSGLGMSIVESLTRAMGGSVRLVDADKGTVIDVTLPAA